MPLLSVLLILLNQKTGDLFWTVASTVLGFAFLILYTLLAVVLNLLRVSTGLTQHGMFFMQD